MLKRDTATGMNWLIEEYGKGVVEKYIRKVRTFEVKKGVSIARPDLLIRDWLENDKVPKTCAGKVWVEVISGKEYIVADNNLGTELMYAGYKPVYNWSNKLFNMPICIEKDRVIILRKGVHESLLPIFSRFLKKKVEIA